MRERKVLRIIPQAFYFNNWVDGNGQSNDMITGNLDKSEDGSKIGMGSKKVEPARRKILEKKILYLFKFQNTNVLKSAAFFFLTLFLFGSEVEV